MTSPPPAISVITPTWQRADCLPRVWQSLEQQGCKDFEWIVADDGSTDDTAGVLRTLARRSSFPVRYLKAEAHVGKARIDNEAITIASGELSFWCDSDDRLAPHAIGAIIEAWRARPAGRTDLIGLTALAGTVEGGAIARPEILDRDGFVRWNDIAHQSDADLMNISRTDLLRAHPFPEVDLVIPESAVWNQIGNAPTILIDEVLMIKEYRLPGAISFSGRMAYGRGRAHALAICTRALGHRPLHRGVGLRRLVNFHRYAIHGELGITEAWRLWRGVSGSLTFWLTLPLGALLALKDRIAGKVDRTHREFLRNRGSRVSRVPLDD